MNVVYDESALSHNLSAAANVSPLHPVVISQFIDDAQEIDIDAVAHQGRLLVHAVSEHVENAGVHSGDATLILPPFSLPEHDLDRLKEIAQKVAKALEISGPYNMQVIRKPSDGEDDAELKVIECNLRASRSFPFVSKVLGTNLIDVASAAIMGINVPEPVDLMKEKREYVAVKVPQFSFTRLAGADPFLGVGESEKVFSWLSVVYGSADSGWLRDGFYRRDCCIWQECPRSLLECLPFHKLLQASKARIRGPDRW